MSKEFDFRTMDAFKRGFKKNFNLGYFVHFAGTEAYAFRKHGDFLVKWNLGDFQKSLRRTTETAEVIGIHFAMQVKEEMLSASLYKIPLRKKGIEVRIEQRHIDASQVFKDFCSSYCSGFRSGFFIDRAIEAALMERISFPWVPRICPAGHHSFEMDEETDGLIHLKNLDEGHVITCPALINPFKAALKKKFKAVVPDLLVREKRETISHWEGFPVPHGALVVYGPKEMYDEAPYSPTRNTEFFQRRASFGFIPSRDERHWDLTSKTKTGFLYDFDEHHEFPELQDR